MNLYATTTYPPPTTTSTVPPPPSSTASTGAPADIHAIGVVALVLVVVGAAALRVASTRARRFTERSE